MTRVTVAYASRVLLPLALTACSTDPEPPRAASIEVTPVAAALTFLGQEAVFIAKATDQYGNDFPGTIAWTSDASAVFTVNSSGIVRAVANGTGSVRAELDGVSGAATVTVTQLPTIVEGVGGDEQRGRPGRVLMDPLVVRVADAGDTPVVGVEVSFSPRSGSGSVTPATETTDADGEARARWALGAGFGRQSVTASVATGASAVFSAMALRPDELADSVEVVSGDGQKAWPGKPLRLPIVVRVLDEYAEPIRSANVLFDAPPGHGSADPDSVKSDGAGEVTTTWTLGDKVGLQLLTASVSGGPSARVAATGIEGVCGRTAQIEDALVSAVGASTCEEVTEHRLSEIRYLDLREMGISRLVASDFEGLTQLERLRLGANRLTELPPGVFAELSNLRYLNLNGNELDPSVGLFTGLSRLGALHLAGNQLTDLPAGSFAGLSDLKHLDLSFNQLGPRPEMFAELSNLTLLRLAYNGLPDLPVGMFSGLADLEQLELEQNELRELVPGAFSGLSELRVLSLWGNELKLRPGMFTGLSSLEHIDLNYNQLTDLPEDVFSELVSLLVLDLGGNQLSLEPGIFADAELSNLEYLKLYENQLEYLPYGVFEGLSSLERLDLGIASELLAIPGGNLLTELPPDLFKGLPSLKAVWANGNPGSPFPLILQIERTDTIDLTAPGPAEVVVSLKEGAPFSMSVGLSASGATLSPSRIMIRTGETQSGVVTVTPDAGTGSVTVTLGEVPVIPSTYCEFERRFAQGNGSWSGAAECFKGIIVRNGDPITLFQ